MIYNLILDDKGVPVTGQKLTQSSYNPPQEVQKLFALCQKEYDRAYTLLNKPWDEFDGQTLLNRTRLDQETFGAFVGVKWQPEHKRWRWQGRKNTARNKLISILAHMLAAMLYPYVNATNERNEEDKMTAKVMRILIENHLKKAGYEVDFLFIVLSALVNPAVFIMVEYVEAFRTVKQRLMDGSIKVTKAVDDILTGLHLHNLPIDELLLTDYHTPLPLQRCVIRQRKISYDQSRAENAGKYTYNGQDVFDFVTAGKTHVMLAPDGQLFDVDWEEGDTTQVQELTFYFPFDDLEVKWVGGVLMGDYTDPMNTNMFRHRRMSLIENEWMLVPMLPFAMAYFEPIDPTGRFVWGKSGAFKEYWDDKFLNTMQQFVHDATYLDVIKVHFLTGVGKMDGAVMVPGATVTLPQGASVTPYSMGPNLAALYNTINMQKDDLSDSTQDRIMQGSVEKGVTAYATSKAEANARVFLGVFGVFIANLIKQIGELSIDCIIQHTTVGEIDATVPEAIRMKYKEVLARGTEKGKNVTNKIVFTDEFMGREFTEDEIKEMEWNMYEENGGYKSDQRTWKVNPYLLARTRYSLTVDPDQITDRSTGNDKQKKALAFQMLTDPRVVQFVDQEAVVEDFVIEEFAEGDPDRYKNKNPQPQGMMPMPGQPAQPVPTLPTNQPQL
jgi:hypothetical protein